jgi:hypothetical protein
MAAKLAHLFLVRDNLNQYPIWERFFADHEAFYTRYAHAKWPEKIRSTWFRNCVIPNLCQTEYATISLVKAELLLLKEALNDKQNHFFLLHSESCIPLHSFKYTYQEIFDTSKSWISFGKGSMERYSGVDQRSIPSLNFYKSSQFFCLTRDHASLLVENANLSLWTRSHCPDEHYVPTNLSIHDRLHECLRTDLTFTFWQGQINSPVTFHAMSPDHLMLLRKTSSLFARKFSERSDISNYVPI